MSEDASQETAQPYHWIGRNVTKPDALEKALGATEYVGDMVMPGMLHAKILWGGTPHAVIRNIDTADAARVPGVAAVLTAADVPGTNRYGLAVLDQRALADDKVRSAGDALALVAAEDEEAAEEAVSKIKVDLEPLRPILTYEDALDPDAPSVHEGGNVFQHTTVRKGDLEKGVQESDVIVENAYHTHRMDHVPMEPEAGLAYVDPSGVLNILVGTQYPYRDRRQIAPALDLAMNKVRVIQAPIGGGFGRKDDITAEIHVGLLALKTRRPVRLVYTPRRVPHRQHQAPPHGHEVPHRRSLGRAADLPGRRHLRRHRRGDLPGGLRHQESGHPRHRPLRRAQHPGGHLHALHQQPGLRGHARLRGDAGGGGPRIADGPVGP